MCLDDGPIDREWTEPVTRPMEGIRVLEVAQWWFVPAAAAVLADWGADVIKVEHPEQGDPQRGLMTGGLLPGSSSLNFMAEQPNRNKRSVGIDLGSPDARGVLEKLIEQADVFLTSFLTPARQRLQIDVDDVRAINPRCIYVRGSGQGVRGPDATKGGYDAASFWSRGGIGAALTAPDAAAPVFQRAAFGDSIGAMNLAAGVSAALFHRERTGEATVVDVSLLGSAMWVLAPDVIAAKQVPGGLPTMDRTQSPNPLVNTYPTADGRWLTLLLLQPDRYWPDFCARIDRPDLLDDERFVDGIQRFMHSKELVATLDETFRQRDLNAWRTALADLEGPWAPMQTAAELYDDPQSIANGYLPEIVTDDGEPAALVSNPVQFGEEPATTNRAPAHGEQTDAVLQELGYDWDAIVELKTSGAVL